MNSILTYTFSLTSANGSRWPVGGLTVAAPPPCETNPIPIPDTRDSGCHPVNSKNFQTPTLCTTVDSLID